jgi:hypothetical protein
MRGDIFVVDSAIHRIQFFFPPSAPEGKARAAGARGV